VSLGAAFALLLGGCSLAQLGHHAFETRAASQGFHIGQHTSGGDSIRYWDSDPDGSSGATPILLIHGFGGDGLSTWRAQMGELAEGRRVIVTDLLWFGQSRGAGDPTLEHQSAAILGLLDELHVDRVDVMGVSYGGFVTLQLLRSAPTRVDRYILVDSPGPFFTEADETAMVARLGAASSQELFLPKGPDDVKRLFALTYAHPPKLSRSLLTDIYRHDFTANHPEQAALLTDLHAHRGEDVLPPRDAHPRPLVVWGEHDPVFPLANGTALAEALGATLAVIPDTAHGPCIERPREFNAVVTAYLEGR